MSRTAGFLVDKRRWIDFYRGWKGKTLPAGEWQCKFVDGIKNTDQYCVFNFKRHRVPLSNSRGSLFQASAQRKFEGCPLEVNLQMDASPIVDVKFTRNVKNKINEKKARCMRKAERNV